MSTLYTSTLRYQRFFIVLIVFKFWVAKAANPIDEIEQEVKEMLELETSNDFRSKSQTVEIYLPPLWSPTS